MFVFNSLKCDMSRSNEWCRNSICNAWMIHVAFEFLCMSMSLTHSNVTRLVRMSHVAIAYVMQVESCHIWMRHVYNINGSCMSVYIFNSFKCDMSHSNEWCRTLNVLCINVSCHMWMSHVLNIKGSRHTWTNTDFQWKWVMLYNKRVR